MEGGVVDRVPVYLAYVEVLLYLGHAGGDDAVGDAPDPVVGRTGVRVEGAEGGPVVARDEGYDAAWGFGSAAVVLAGGEC
jgi:hypothetical protein